MSTITVYGVGGYDPSKPNNNVIEEVDVGVSDPVEHNLAQQKARAVCFAAEADPLFFKWQAGEGSKQAWEDKREEIRLRFPYYFEP
jgi:hypothetical protein